MDDIVRRRQVAEIATRSDVLAFWNEHGSRWASEEASQADRDQIVKIARDVAGLSDTQAAAAAVAELKQIWTSGLPGGDEGFGWDEMNDRLPDMALLAFVRGVESA